MLAAAPGRAAASRGTSSRADRQDAIAGLPVGKLDPNMRRLVDEVVERATIFRRMPTQVIRCDPELFQFIVDHPEIMANIWKLLNLDDVALEPVGPDAYRAFDEAGTTGVVEYLYRTHDTQLIYAEGTYDGPLFAKPVRGRCVMLLKSHFVRESDGYYYVTTRLDAFVELDHAALEFLAKTFQPLMGRVADNSFAQTAAFMDSLSAAAENNQAGVRRLAARLTDVSPQVRRRFVEVTSNAATRADIRRTGVASQSRAPSRLARTQNE